MLKKMLTDPPIKKIDLVFPLGLEVTARNLRGVTIKDALDAIYKQFKKKVCLPIASTAHFCGEVSVADIYLSTGRRRARRPLPPRLRVGPRGVLHPLHRAPEEDRRPARGRGQEEGQEGQG